VTVTIWYLQNGAEQVGLGY